YDIHFVDANGSDPANTIVNPKSYLRISANGNVGIGSLNPQSKLDVEGNVSMLTGSHKMYFNELYSFDNTKAGFRNNTGNLVMNAKNGGVLYLNRDVTAETRIQSYSGSDAIDIAVFKPNGSVGIGALDPQAKLDVEGNVSILTGLHKMYFNELSSFDNTKAGFRNNAGNLIMNAKSGGILYLNRDVTAETHIQSFSGSDAIDIAVFKPNGSVGIGTSNTNDPSFRLFVETGIRTRRVKVDAYAWADYVFHPGYQLNSLPEVEHFINTHQHLPDVPSAAEVEKNGLDLGDTQALLLKKIEELTLYLIVQNKKIEMLTRKVAQLENSGIR
ncbi:MAG TPA: hypothetical protein VHK91_14870, partial [Flavisolibacter sp.]|nr:hypothetical protein [Flavisolibacter sp.]